MPNGPNQFEGFSMDTWGPRGPLIRAARRPGIGGFGTLPETNISGS